MNRNRIDQEADVPEGRPPVQWTPRACYLATVVGTLAAFFIVAAAGAMLVSGAR